MSGSKKDKYSVDLRLDLGRRGETPLRSETPTPAWSRLHGVFCPPHRLSFTQRPILVAGMTKLPAGVSSNHELELEFIIFEQTIGARWREHRPQWGC